MPVFQPLLDARVGELAEYRNALDETLRYEVIEADAHKVVLRVTMSDEHGHTLGAPTRREEARDEDPLARHAGKYRASTAYGDERIEVAGQTWDALLCDSRWTDDDGVAYLRQTWVSPEAPVLGLLRMKLYAQRPGEGQGLDSELELIRMAMPAQ